MNMEASIAICMSGTVDTHLRIAVATPCTGVVVYSLRPDGSLPCVARLPTPAVPSAVGANTGLVKHLARSRRRRHSGIFPSTADGNNTCLYSALLHCNPFSYSFIVFSN
jgi:hypothetical protein